MIDNPADLLPMWMLIAASAGLMIGWTCGDEVRRRKCAEQELNSLRDQLERQQPDARPLFQLLKQQRGVINDIHKRLFAVSKGSRKQA